MGNHQDAARRVLIGKLVTDVVKEDYGDTAALLAALLADGIRSLNVIGPAGQTYGGFTVCDGKTTVHVDDEDAFMAWIRRDHPEWLVETIDPGKRKDLLTLIERMGEAVDPGTGQVIPGVTVKQGNSYLTTRKTADARQMMRDVLAGHPLLALPAAPAAPSQEGDQD